MYLPLCRVIVLVLLLFEEDNNERYSLFQDCFSPDNTTFGYPLLVGRSSSSTTTSRGPGEPRTGLFRYFAATAREK